MTRKQIERVGWLYRRGYKPVRITHSPCGVITVAMPRKMGEGALLISIDRDGLYKRAGRDYRFETLRSAV